MLRDNERTERQRLDLDGNGQTAGRHIRKHNACGGRVKNKRTKPNRA